MLERTAPSAVNGARRLARQGVARLAGQARNRQTRRRALAHRSARPRIGDRIPPRSARPLTRPGARRRLAPGSRRRSCQRARCGFDSGASLPRGRTLGGVAIGRAGARKSTFPRCRSARGRAVGVDLAGVGRGALARQFCERRARRALPPSIAPVARVVCRRSGPPPGGARRGARTSSAQRSALERASCARVRVATRPPSSLQGGSVEGRGRAMRQRFRAALAPGVWRRTRRGAAAATPGQKHASRADSRGPLAPQTSPRPLLAEARRGQSEGLVPTRCLARGGAAIRALFARFFAVDK